MASLTFATTNEDMAFGQNGIGVFGGFTMKEIIFTHVLIAFTANKKHDQPMSQVIVSLAEYLDRTPANISNHLPEVAIAMGADSPRRVQDVILRGWWPEEFARGVTYASANAQPLLEHQKGTSAMTTVFALMTAFATLTLILRIWSREILVMRLMMHDWFMVLGFILSLTYGIISLLHASLLQPAVALWDMSWNTYSQAHMYQTVLSLVYPLPLFFIKTSLLLFYLRLCPSCPSEIRSVFRTSIFVTFFFILTTCVTNFFVILLQCDQLAYWEAEATIMCKLDSKMAQIALGGVSVVTDILLWLMPLPVVWQLDLGKREKVLAVVTFGIAAIACVVSAFRLRAIQMYGYVTDGKLLSVNVSILTVVELNLAIICSSAPAIRALIIHYAPRLLNVYSQSTRRVRRPSDKDIKQLELSNSSEEEDDGSTTYTISVGINVRQGDYPMSPGGGAVTLGGGGLRPGDVEKGSPVGSVRSMRRLA
ncbi:hypothetical protein TWF106_008779 [Orbilia oligospora]|uniref:Rhodopsin domain-containing protein n=2 Tax=Orbilia oligospora TaxID=2813651 RepID=A0A6G1M4C1_ORBOL|nr:hypothetical protein TWF788_003670 [Orbilia oligospora]KAF3215272.1 hypothetical protein TWF106_008779 [Orbilia oligospora]KAF3227812.1 hypothetical protein TWF191_003334 [Orbilia oligospora]KAF3244738.1 hypothetical protein TWF192_007672 [Orbilia oligospora]